MSRFSADFIPLSGADIFDMSGSMPPSLTVIMNVPEDVDAGFFKFNKGGDEPDATAHERFVNQDKLKKLLIERYRNLAQSRLWAMRRDKHLGVTDTSYRIIELAQGVTMQYANLWGMEYVTLIFSEGLVRELLVEAIGGGPCLLVLYGGNEIAAVPMIFVRSGAFNAAVYKRTLHDSNWGLDAISKVAQEWLSDDLCVILSEVAFSPKKIEFGAGKLTDQNLHHSISASEEFDSSNPVMNGKFDKNAKVSTIYTLCAAYSFDAKKGFKKIRDVDPASKTSTHGSVSNAGVIATFEIPQSFEDYWENFSDTGHINFLNIERKPIAPRYRPPVPVEKPLSSSYVVTWTPDGSGMGKGYIHTVLTATFPHGVLINTVDGSADPTVYRTHGKSETSFDFPYAVDGKYYYGIAEGSTVVQSGTVTTDEWSYSIYTPYGQHTGTFLSPLWNLRDGGILIQGYRVVDGTFVWANGKQVTKIAKVPVADIQAMFINIPLAQIRKFK
jgi:hypothetical protein